MHDNFTDKNLKKLILYLVLCLSYGCVTAPNVDRARILPDEEVEALTVIKRAKDFASSGRHDLAEQELRKAIIKLPRQSSVFNDLGVALMSQSRYAESAQMFLHATKLDPGNAVALENYAKVLYLDQDYFSAIKQFNNLLDLLYSKTEEQILKSSGKIYADQEFVGILRNMASANFAMGYYDEALCLSNQALLKSPDLFQVGVHSRLLLLFGKIDETYGLLDNTVIGLNGAVPPGMMLDYAVTLFIKKDFEKAAVSADNALKNPQINSEEKSVAFLTSYLILSKQKKHKEAASLAATIINSNDRLCNSSQLMKNSYYPTTFEDQLNLVRGRICKIQSGV